MLFTDDVNLETLTEAVNSLLDTLKALSSHVDPQPIIKTTLGYVLSGMTVLGIDPPESVIQFIKCLQNDVLDLQCPNVFLEPYKPTDKPLDQRNLGSKTFAIDVIL